MTPIHDRGLTFDLATLNRRRALTLLGGADLAGLTAHQRHPHLASFFGHRGRVQRPDCVNGWPVSG